MTPVEIGTSLIEHGGPAEWPAGGLGEALNAISRFSSVDPDQPAAGYSFAGFRLEPDGTLWRGKSMVHVPPKELAALRFLLAHAGQVVTSQQLRSELWGDAHVTADSVPKCISSLRARLEPEDCIQTVYKRGYRMAAEVRSREQQETSALPRLAIVPFTAAFGFPEHLCAAVVEGVQDRLVNLRPQLAALLAADSVATLARRDLTAQQIGQALNADLVLKATLRALPAQFRLRAEMIRVADGTQIWVEDMLADKAQPGALEDKLVQRLLFRLGPATPAGDGLPSEPAFAPGAERMEGPGLSIVAEAESVSARRPARNHPSTGPAGVDSAASQKREAHDLYLKARHGWQTMERHDMQDSLQGLLRAIELDPTLYSAHVELANLCLAQASYGYMAPAVAAGYVRAAAEAVPEGTPQAEAILPGVGWVKFHVDRDMESAASAFARTGGQPHDPWLTRMRLMFVLSRHRFDEAVSLLRARLREDPYSPLLHGGLAWALHLGGHAQESAERILQALELFPGHECIHFFGSLILAFNGDTERSAKLAHEFARHKPHLDLAAIAEANALASSGRADDARAVLHRMQWLSRERFVIRSFTPAVHLALGDRESALRELAFAEENRCPWFFQVLADPRLRALHGEPRFEEMRAILTRMEDEAEEVGRSDN